MVLFSLLCSSAAYTSAPDGVTDKPRRVTDMYGMFLDATSFNGDVSKWFTGRVTNMHDMFYYATSFNGDVANGIRRG
jgi:surface protein